MPHASTREELRHWAKEVWEKITGHKEEEMTIKGWLARDKNKELLFYTKKPRKSSYEWSLQGGDVNIMSRELFPSIRWEDPEPTPCEITIRIKK